jgi:hypothetical protein
MTAIGGVGHTLPFLIHDFHLAMVVAALVVVVELKSLGQASIYGYAYAHCCVAGWIGGALVFPSGVLIGALEGQVKNQFSVPGGRFSVFDQQVGCQRRRLRK